jgi:hypothetical protein
LTKVGFAALLVGLAAGCEKPPREAFDCACRYLTDTDVPGEQKASVCAERGATPESVASECVSGMGVGHVESCSCTKAEHACATERCVVLEDGR